MNRMLAFVLIGCVMSAASANTITLNLSTLTDGNLYSYHGYGDADTDYVTEEIGVLSLNESISFGWDVAYVDGPTVFDSSTRTIYSLATTFNPSDQTVPNGLLSIGLLPSFTPTSEESYSEVSTSMLWFDYDDPAVRDRGSIQFDLFVSWGAGMTDELGVNHSFGYYRQYSFYNNTLVTSVDDLAIFSEALFYEMLASPATQYVFQEGFGEWSSRCDEFSCVPGERWGYYLDGTFEVTTSTAVPEPLPLALFGVGGLMAYFGSRRRANRC